MADDMDLPAGLTCRDCAHFGPKCSWLISSLTGDETRCDWSPSRFKPRPIGGGAPEDDFQELADRVVDAYAELGRLRASNAELLAALRDCFRGWYQGEDMWGPMQVAREILRRADVDPNP